jgi:hypothetical protein
LHQPIRDDLYGDDRGQTDLKPGYVRRQIQFFYYRTFSGIFAQIFFLIASPVFRFWTNQDYYPFYSVAGTSILHNPHFHPVSASDYLHACIFGLARLGTLVLLLPVSTVIMYFWLPVRRELIQMAQLYRKLLTSAAFILFIAVALIGNELLCAWMALLHNQIWFIGT